MKPSVEFSNDAVKETDARTLARSLNPIACQVDGLGIVWENTGSAWVPFCTPGIAAHLITDQSIEQLCLPNGEPTTIAFRSKADKSVWAVHANDTSHEGEFLRQLHELPYYEALLKMRPDSVVTYLNHQEKYAQQIAWSPALTRAVASRRQRRPWRIAGAVGLSVSAIAALGVIDALDSRHGGEPRPSASAVLDPSPLPTPEQNADQVETTSVDTAFTVYSHNVYYKNLRRDANETSTEFDAKVATVVEHLLSLDAGILGLQEVQNSEGRLALYNKMIACADCRYDGYMPDLDKSDQGGGKTPILWRRDTFEFVGGDENQGSTSIQMSSSGYNQVRAFTYIKLRHISTGNQFWIVNAHFPHGVEKADGKLNGTAKRQKDYENLMSEYAKFVKSKADETVLTMGDFNVGAVAQRKNCAAEPDNPELCVPYFPLTVFQNLGNVSVWDLPNTVVQPTLRRRTVDYIAVNSGKLQMITLLPQQPKGRSDHSPVGVLFNSSES